MRQTAFVVSIMAALVFAGFTPAHAVSPDGVWVGSGYATPSSGQRERIRCRVTYSRVNNKIFNVVAVCATTATKIRQTGELVMVRPGLYVGDFNNRQYDISGRVRVTQRGNSQSVTFSSDSGRGSLSLRRR